MPEGRLLDQLFDDCIEPQNRFLQFLDLFEHQIVIHFLADFFLPGMRDDEHGLLSRAWAIRSHFFPPEKSFRNLGKTVVGCRDYLIAPFQKQVQLACKR